MKRLMFAMALCLISAAGSVGAATVTADQGQIFGTNGQLDLGTAFYSQSVTTGIAGKLAGIEVQFHNFEMGGSYPIPSVIPTIDFAIYAGGNPVSGSPLFSKTYSFQLSDFDSSGLYIFDLMAGNLVFNVGEVFTFAFQASGAGLNWAGNDQDQWGAGYPGGSLYVDGSPSTLSDIAFITYVAPVPLPATLALLLAGIGGLGLAGRARKQAT